MSVVYLDGIFEGCDELLPGGVPFFRKYTDARVELEIAYLLKKYPHPNIVTIYRVGTDHYDMELLRTTSWRDLSFMKIVKDYLQGLGIYYVDWKTDNVCIDSQGVPKLIDFDASFYKGVGGFIGFRYRDALSAGCKTIREIDDHAFRVIMT